MSAPTASSLAATANWSSVVVPRSSIHAVRRRKSDVALPHHGVTRRQCTHNADDVFDGGWIDNYVDAGDALSCDVLGDVRRGEGRGGEHGEQSQNFGCGVHFFAPTGTNQPVVL